MIGILIVTHNQLGKVLIDSAEMLLGDMPESVIAISTDSEEPDKLREKIAREIRRVDRRDGVLIFTDMFGGSPCNIVCSFIEEGRTDVISSVNLPVLLKAVSSRKTMKLSELSECVEAYGKRSISLASGILKGKKRTQLSRCPFGVECG